MCFLFRTESCWRKIIIFRNSLLLWPFISGNTQGYCGDSREVVREDKVYIAGKPKGGSSPRVWGIVLNGVAASFLGIGLQGGHDFPERERDARERRSSISIPSAFSGPRNSCLAFPFYLIGHKARHGTLCLITL
jgi:hypothetical protein